MSEPFKPAATLEDIQREPARIASLGLSTLAWLMHEAESEEDDLSMMALEVEAEARGRDGESIVRAEYMRLWPEHARTRGYERRVA